MPAVRADRRHPGGVRRRRGGAPGSVRIREEAVEAVRRDAARRVAARARPRARRARRAPRRLPAHAQRDQLRLGLVPDAAQAPGMSRLPHGRGRACAPAARGRRRSSPRIGRDEVAAALGQDPEHELMGLFETALRELGARVRDEHGGSFLALARSHGSARRSRPSSRRWPTWHDVSPYDGCGSRSSSAPRSPPPTSRSPASRPATTSTASRCSPTTSSRTCCGSTACSSSTTPSSPASTPRS